MALKVVGNINRGKGLFDIDLYGICLNFAFQESRFEVLGLSRGTVFAQITSKTNSKLLGVGNVRTHM